MELLQDGGILAFALLALIVSVVTVEWLIGRATPSRGTAALWGILFAFVEMFVVSEFAGWLASLSLGLPRMTGYGRTFSYAAFGLILYVPIRIYQVMRQRRQEGAP